MTILLNIINNLRETEGINPELNYSRNTFDSNLVKKLVQICTCEDD